MDFSVLIFDCLLRDSCSGCNSVGRQDDLKRYAGNFKFQYVVLITLIEARLVRTVYHKGVVRISEVILGSCNWVSKVGQVTGRYRASASRNAFSSGPRIHWSVNAVASIRLLCNDVNCKYLPQGPHSGAARRGRDCARRHGK